MFPVKVHPPVWAVELFSEYLSFTACIHHTVWSVGVSGGGARSLFSFFLLCRVSGEGRKEQAALRPPCFPLFVPVCFYCLVERCINVRQNVRLPLQRPIGSKPHICWNYNNQSGRFQLSFCLWTRCLCLYFNVFQFGFLASFPHLNLFTLSISYTLIACIHVYFN